MTDQITRKSRKKFPQFYWWFVYTQDNNCPQWSWDCFAMSQVQPKKARLFLHCWFDKCIHFSEMFDRSSFYINCLLRSYWLTICLFHVGSAWYDSLFYGQCNKYKYLTCASRTMSERSSLTRISTEYRSSSRVTMFASPSRGRDSKSRLQTLALFLPEVVCHRSYLWTRAMIESFRLARTCYFSTLSSMSAISPTF